jgi:flagellar protein FliO/FliZ
VKGAVTLLLLILPSLAIAEGSSSPDFSFFSSFLQMIAALSIVVGLILLTKHFSTKLLSGSSGPLTAKHIRIIETRFVGPKKSLVLVEVGGKYLLLASSENNLTLIKQVDMIEEIEIVEERTSFKSEILGLFGRKVERRND